MKQIKFRAWDKTINYMDYRVRVSHYGGVIEVLDSWSTWRELKKGEYELMQCTGLKDKNGVEIFEGDVLYFEPYVTHLNDRVVRNIDGAYHGTLIRSGYSKLLAECVYETKVIGNIYENPELLEEMKFTKDNVLEVFKHWHDTSNGATGSFYSAINNLDDTPEKVVVPKCVADVFSSELHFEYEIQESRDIPHVLSAAFGEVSSNKNIKFLQWVKQHPDKYVMAVKYGYEVEKDAVTEQRYSVVIADRYLVQLFIGRTDYRFIEFDELCAWKPSAFQLTESEIKEIDERYWAFAVPVQEVK